MIDGVKRFFTRSMPLLAALLAVVTAIYGATAFIDWRIASALNEPSIVRRIALAARPEMIIDNNGTVEVDRGAMDYISNIKVTKKSNSPVADTIVITPRRYMAHAPLVTSVDGASLNATPERGQKLDWVIKLEWNSFSEPGRNRLRIEIIDR
jgi:hypothetical protein